MSFDDTTTNETKHLAIDQSHTDSSSSSSQSVRLRRSNMHHHDDSQTSSSSSTTLPNKRASRRPNFLDIYPHCIEGEVGSAVHPYLQQDVPAAVTVEHHHRYDFQPLLERAIPLWKDAGVEQVFLCGMSLDGT